MVPTEWVAGVRHCPVLSLRARKNDSERDAVDE